MGWSSWGKSGNLTTIMNKTNEANRKANRKQKQIKPTIVARAKSESAESGQ
jgi:hypothetical protein